MSLGATAGTSPMNDKNKYKILKIGKGGKARKIKKLVADTNYSTSTFEADGHTWEFRGCWFWMAGLSDESVERVIWREYDALRSS